MLVGRVAVSGKVMDCMIQICDGSVGDKNELKRQGEKEEKKKMLEK